MWNKRKEEEYPDKAAASPVSSAGVPREAQPSASTSPTAGFHMPERGTAVIGKSVVVRGQVFSREDLIVDGEVDGAIELQENRLTIGPHGRIQATVKAREIVVLGAVNGNVEASDRIDIRKDAKLVGDLKTSRIVIEDGAYFKGSIDIVKAEAKATPPPAPPAAAPQPRHPVPPATPQAPVSSFAAPASSANAPATSAAKPSGR